MTSMEVFALATGAIMGLLIGVLVGGAAGRVTRRTYPTLQEQIDAVCAASTPATAEDLMRLTEKRMVKGAGNKFHLGVQLGPVEIKMPEREHYALLLQDVPAFEALVAAASAAAPAP